MTKSRLSKSSSVGPVPTDATGEKLVTQVLHIYKDLCAQRKRLDYHNSKVQASSALISKLHEDLIQTIAPIAARMEFFGNQASQLSAMGINARIVTPLHLNTALQQLSDQRDLEDLRMQTPDVTTSPDLNCVETFANSSDPWNVPLSPVSGFMEIPELESQDWHTIDFQELLTKSRELNGGAATSSRRRSSSTTTDPSAST
jgi:hypothetical protein